MNQVSSEGSDFKIQCLVVSLLLFRRISAGNAGLGGRKAEGALLSWRHFRDRGFIVMLFLFVWQTPLTISPSSPPKSSHSRRAPSSADIFSLSKDLLQMGVGDELGLTPLPPTALAPAAYSAKPSSWFTTSWQAFPCHVHPADREQASLLINYFIYLFNNNNDQTHDPEKNCTLSHLMINSE